MEKNILIIGGTGKMGQWFAKFFKNKKFKVKIYGRNPVKTKKIAKSLGVDYSLNYVEDVKNVSMVLVSTPIEVTPKIILEVAKNLKKGSILFDVASIKHDVLPALKKAEKFSIHTLSLHPMFGPGAKSVKDKAILTIPVTRNIEVLKFVLKPFLDSGAKIVWVKDAKTHDKMVALTLALPHFLNIVFGKTLSTSGFNIKKIKDFGGTTFNLQLILTESVVQEDPNLYASIQTQNKYFIKVMEELFNHANNLKKIVLNKEKDKFSKFFLETRKFLAEDPEFKNAYKKFYFLLFS